MDHTQIINHNSPRDRSKIAQTRNKFRLSGWSRLEYPDMYFFSDRINQYNRPLSTGQNSSSRTHSQLYHSSVQPFGINISIKFQYTRLRPGSLIRLKDTGKKETTFFFFYWDDVEWPKTAHLHLSLKGASFAKWYGGIFWGIQKPP